MSYWKDVYMQHEQRIDHRQAAEQRRLIRETRASQPATAPCLRAAPGRNRPPARGLGQRRLEAHYDAVESTARMSARIA